MAQFAKIMSLGRRSNVEESPPGPTRRTDFKEKRLVPSRRIDFTTHLAFDWDDCRLRMVAVKRTGWRRKVLATKSIAVPQELAAEADHQSWVADQVRLLVSRWGQGSRRVSLVLGGRETAFRSFLMPHMKDRDLRNAVEFEAREQLPFPTERCQLGYRLTSQLVRKDGPSRLRLAMHAATSDFVAGQLEPFRRAGIEVHDVCHAPDLTGLLLRELRDDSTGDQTCTLVDLSHDACRISFYRDAALEFSLVNAIGASPIGEFTDGTTLEAFADSLIREIQTSQDYYLGQFGKDLSSNVHLCGDWPTVVGLCRLLDGRSNLNFAPFPVEKLPISIDTDTRHQDWLSMIPLVGAAGSAYRGVNLLPQKDRRQLREKQLGQWVRTGAVLLMLVMLAGWGAAEYRNRLVAARADQSESRLTRLKGSEVYRTYHALKRQIMADQAYLELARKVPTSFHLALKNLSRVVPESVTLTSMQFLPSEPEHTLSIAGIVRSSDIPPEIILAELVADLRASPFFAGVTILRHTKSRGEDGFTMKFHLGMEGIAS